MDEAADVGRNTASPVGDDYEGESSVFTGTVNWVQIDLGEDAGDADHLMTPEERLRVASSAVGCARAFANCTDPTLRAPLLRIRG